MRIGIGYIFGAEDKGLTRTIRDVGDGMDDVGASTKTANSFATKFRDTMLGLGNLQLSNISGQLDSLQSNLQGVTGSGIDTQIESMFTSFDQGFAKSAVMAGKTGAELKKLESQVFSTAFAMNRSADEVGANALAIEKAGLAIEDIAGPGGSLSDVQKILEVTNMSGEQFATTFQDLNKSWGFGAKGTKDFLDRFASVNAQLGMGSEAFEALPGMLSAIDDGFGHLDMKPEQIESTIFGMTNLAKALEEGIGESPQEAMSKATSMFTALAQEGKSFDQMMAGVEGGIGGLTMEFANLGMGDAFAEMQKSAQDPAAFIQSIATAFAGLDENGSEAAKVLKTRMRMQLAQINPSFSFLAANGEGAVDVFKHIAEVTPEAGKGLNHLAKEGYRSGLTLQESIDRARMSMEQAFGGASADERRAFARSMRNSYKLVATTVRNLTGESEKFAESWREQAAGMGMSAKSADKLRGVLGPVVEYMATFASTGIHGVMIKIFGENSVLASGFGVIASGVGQLLPALMPLFVALPTLMPILSGVGSALAGLLSPLLSLAGPILAVAGAVGVLYLAFTGKLPAAIQYVSKTAQDAFLYVANLGTTLLNKVTAMFSSLNGKKMAKALISNVGKAFSALFAAFNGPMVAKNPAVSSAAQNLIQAFAGALSAGGTFVKDFASTLLNSVMQSIKATNFSKAALSMSAALASGFNAALAQRKMLYTAVMSAIQNTDWKALGKRLSNALGAIRTQAASAFVSVMKDVQDFMSKVDWADVGMKVGEAMADGLIMAGALLLKAGAALADLVVGAFSLVTTKQFWVDTFEVIVEGLYTALQGVASLYTFIQGVFAGIGAKIVDALFGPQMAQVYRDTFKKNIDNVTKLFQAFFDGVRDMAYALFGNSINSFVEHDFSVIQTILETAQGWFMSLKDIAGTVFESATAFISKMFDKFKIVGTLITGIADRFGFTTADVEAITSESSGASTPAAATAVARNGNNDLILLLTRQHNENAVYFKQMADGIRKMSKTGPGSATAAAPQAAATSTTGE